MNDTQTKEYADPRGTRPAFRKLATVLAGALLLTLCQQPLHAVASGGPIGADQARAIALNHAGVEESSLYDMKVKQEEKHGRIRYEIKFESGDMKYEYDIDAMNGSILSHERDRRGYYGRGHGYFNGSSAPFISADDAKAIALKHAGIAESDARVVKLARYDKRGVMLYDIKFLSGWGKYSYEVNASTGAVMAHYHNRR